jgi:diketogulonate reductase-like aldo/keto reductase
MDLKELGGTGVKIPAIGLGTWEIGGGMTGNSSEDKKAVQAIRKAVDLGMYLIDTAEIYGAGHAEELVGEAVRSLPREKVFIVSKVWRNHLHYNDVIKAAENSLKRLKTDWIDLYLVHWPNLEVPIIETIEAMEKLAERKLVRFIGVSNFDAGQMEEASKCLSRNKLVVNQVDYNVRTRDVEKDVLPYCQRRQMVLMAYRPLARRELTANPFLREIGQSYNKTAAQVALNWLIAHEGVIAIPKAVNPAHLEENAGAMGWRLTPQDLERISAHFS